MTSQPSPRPISPLRARMIEDMTVRGFTEKTRQDYVRHMQAFAAFIGRSPRRRRRGMCAVSSYTRGRAACSRRASTQRSRRCAFCLP